MIQVAGDVGPSVTRGLGWRGCNPGARQVGGPGGGKLKKFSYCFHSSKTIHTRTLADLLIYWCTTSDVMLLSVVTFIYRILQLVYSTLICTAVCGIGDLVND